MFKHLFGMVTIASIIISFTACSDNSTSPKNEDEGISSEQNASSSIGSSSSYTTISSSSIKFQVLRKQLFRVLVQFHSMIYSKMIFY